MELSYIGNKWLMFSFRVLATQIIDSIAAKLF